MEGGSGGVFIGREPRRIAVAATQEGERLTPPPCHAEAHHVGRGGHHAPRRVDHLHPHQGHVVAARDQPTGMAVRRRVADAVLE